jgi:hypothetical protein
MSETSEPIFRWAARVLVNSVEACRHGRKVCATVIPSSVIFLNPAVSFSPD